ncbi:hypothetical protein [Roseovarius autotrophicus]|uniref:hypothetical protein n=1 Tax=Roseovarius autotrophicus TaxID=2824121 RepID=UPI001A0E6059|nr:hypothetical protein [Roseovarius autotrophicus]MBE0452362.1 hypothetical protein [Roseovarius sp.]
MSGGGLITLLAVLVLIVAVLRAAQAIRQDRAIGRGTEPGQGHSVIESHYSSGGAGGGHSMSYRIPRDPQTYAKLFIPKDRRK